MLTTENPDKKQNRQNRGNKSPRKQTNASQSNTIKTRSRSPKYDAKIKSEENEEDASMETVGGKKQTEDHDEFLQEIDNQLTKSKSKRKMKVVAKIENSGQTDSVKGSTMKKESKVKVKNEPKAENHAASSGTPNNISVISNKSQSNKHNYSQKTVQKVRSWIELKSKIVQNQNDQANIDIQKNHLSLLDLIEAVNAAVLNLEGDEGEEHGKIFWPDVHEASQSFFKINNSAKTKFIQKLILDGLDLTHNELGYDAPITATLKHQIKEFEKLNENMVKTVLEM